MTNKKDYNKIFEENVEGIIGGTYCLTCGTMLLLSKTEQDSHNARGHNVQKMDLVFRKSIFKMFDEVEKATTSEDDYEWIRDMFIFDTIRLTKKSVIKEIENKIDEILTTDPNIGFANFVNILRLEIKAIK